MINGATDSATYAGVITGTGTLRKTGGSNQTLSGANTFNGLTAIDGGTITLARPLALQNSTVSINVNNGLVLSGLNAVTLGDIVGEGNFDFGGGRSPSGATARARSIAATSTASARW